MFKFSTAHSFLLASAIFAAPSAAVAQAEWRTDTRGAAGPIAQVALSDSEGKRRSVFVAFEYARRCDPLFSIIEISGGQLGAPIEQSALKGSKIGIVLNGRFHTWHAATTKYSNGYEAGFGLTNELFDLLLSTVNALIFVTPTGESVPVPTNGIQKALKEAFGVCAKRFG